MRHIVVVLLCVLLTLISGGCRRSSARLIAQETKIAAEVYATQTAEVPASSLVDKAVVVAPSATSTITPSPTATLRPSDTPTPQPSATPSPTATATPEDKELTPDLSKVALTLSDLPRGYQTIDTAQFGFSPSTMAGDEYEIDSVAVFGQFLRFQFVAAGSALLTDEQFVADFDEMAQDPDALLEFVAGSVSVDALSDQQLLEGYGDLGDSSMAMSALTNMQGFRLRMDVAVVRRDTAVGFVVLMHLDGRKADLDLREMAELMDERLMDAWEAAE